MTTASKTTADEKDRPLGELIGDITDDLSRLFRQEVELATAEARQEGKKAATAGAGFLAAGVAGLLTAILLSFALVYALAEVMHIGWAALIVAVLWAVAAFMFQASARQKMSTIKLYP
jgi:hypothetical protein